MIRPSQYVIRRSLEQPAYMKVLFDELGISFSFPRLTKKDDKKAERSFHALHAACKKLLLRELSHCHCHRQNILHSKKDQDQKRLLHAAIKEIVKNDDYDDDDDDDDPKKN